MVKILQEGFSQPGEESVPWFVPDLFGGLRLLLFDVEEIDGDDDELVCDDDDVKSDVAGIAVVDSA